MDLAGWLSWTKKPAWSALQNFMDFTEQESCGKCVPAERTHLMNEILDDIVNGRGTKEQIDMLMELADTITTTSLCGLGKLLPCQL